MTDGFQFTAADDGTIVWDFDDNNQPVTVLASDAKARFANLSAKQLSVIKQSLVALGMKPTVAAQKSLWSTIIDGAAQNYATATENGTTPTALFPFVTKFVNRQLKSGGFGGAGGSASMQYLTLTEAETARNNLRQDMVNLIGRVPTDDEYKDYVKKLNRMERKYASTVVQGAGTQTTYRKDFDSDAFTVKYILSKTDLNVDLNKEFGVAQDTVNQLLSNSGVAGNITPAKKNKLIKQFITKELSSDALVAEVNKISKNAYGAFADLMDSDPTLTLDQVANDWIGTYANMLEVNPNNVDIKDALSKASVNQNGVYSRLSLSDYEKALRKDERYQYTKRASDEAQNLAYAFAKAFGVNV
jgi:hypothetical protein